MRVFAASTNKGHVSNKMSFFFKNVKAIEHFIEALMSNKIAIEFKQQQLRRGSKG